MEGFSASFALSIFKELKSWANESRIRTQTETHDIEDAVNRHLMFVKNWANDFLLREMVKSKNVVDIFVAPFLGTGTSLQDSTNDKREYKTLLRTGINRVVFGYPGAGKTTLLRRLCSHILFDEPDTSEVNFYHFPVVVVLRRLGRNEGILENLISVFGIEFDDSETLIDPSKRRQHRKKNLLNLLSHLLNNNKVLVLLDGLDELPFEKQEEVRIDLRELFLVVEYSDFVITARTQTNVGDLTRVEKLIICPFTSDDVKAFARKWFVDPDQTLQFLDELRGTPYFGATVRPLTLATLCSLYEKYGSIPNPPKEVYRRLVHMYLDNWDEHRDIHRSSKYARFGVDQKREFLGALAFQMAVAGASLRFNEAQLTGAFNKVKKRFCLENEDERKVISEVESHTGLIVEAGFQEFEFYHKSLLEYFVGDELVRMPLSGSLARKCLRMPDSWAIAVSLSSDPVNYLYNSVYHIVTVCEEDFFIGQVRSRIDVIDSFWIQFIERLRVESVSFETSASLAISFLLVANEAWKACQLDSPNHRVFDVLKNFGKENNLRRAFQTPNFSSILVESTTTSKNGRYFEWVNNNHSFKEPLFLHNSIGQY